MDVKEDKNNSDENVSGKVKSDSDNKVSENDNEVSSGVKKTFSRRRAFLRIILGFIAILLWVLIGLSPTIIFSSSLQEFIGAFSFLVKNPIIFLFVAFFNIAIGVAVYFGLGIVWWAAFHFIWSIRWFYGYFKYRSTTLQDVIKGMRK
jgi:hypothetical protein